jgi:chromate transporter
MAAVTWQLGLASLIDLLTVVIALASIVLLLRYKVNATWLVIGGAALGLMSALWR